MADMDRRLPPPVEKVISYRLSRNVNSARIALGDASSTLSTAMATSRRVKIKLSEWALARHFHRDPRLEPARVQGVFGASDPPCQN